MSNTHRIKKKKEAPVRMDFTGYTPMHLVKSIVYIRNLRARGARLSKTGRAQLAALETELAERGFSEVVPE